MNYVRGILILLIHTILASSLYAQTEFPKFDEMKLDSGTGRNAPFEKSPPSGAALPSLINRPKQNPDYIAFRSLDFGFVVNSGSLDSEDKFESMSHWNAGITWEFPFVAKRLGGGTPILKVRAGRADIRLDDEAAETTTISENREAFIDSLGVSELYTIGIGGGYCYHKGFNCLYGIYTDFLTGQLSTVDEEGRTTVVPTQLRGFTVGMSSTFEVIRGAEMTLGWEYSIYEHVTTFDDPEEINGLALVVGMGFQEIPRPL